MTKRVKEKFFPRRKLLAQGLGLSLLSFFTPLKAMAQVTGSAFWKKRAHPIALDPVGALGSADINASQSSFTFSAMPFGAIHPNRRVFAFFAWRDAANISDPTGATIGGVTANLVARNGYETTSVVIYEALVPTGASGDVTIDFAEAISYGCSCTLLRFINLTTTPTSTTSTEVSKGTGGSNPIIPGNLTSIPAKSYVIALGALQNTTSDLAWSSLTELVERNGANGFQYSIAYAYFPTAQASLGQSFFGASGVQQTCCWNFIY